MIDDPEEEAWQELERRLPGNDAGMFRQPMTTEERLARVEHVLFHAWMGWGHWRRATFNYFKRHRPDIHAQLLEAKKNDSLD